MLRYSARHSKLGCAMVLVVLALVLVLVLVPSSGTGRRCRACARPRGTACSGGAPAGGTDAAWPFTRKGRGRRGVALVLGLALNGAGALAGAGAGAGWCWGAGAGAGAGAGCAYLEDKPRHRGENGAREAAAARGGAEGATVRG